MSQEEADRRYAEIVAQDGFIPATDEDYEDDSAMVVFFRPLPDERVDRDGKN
jgi:hypothetical protein